MGKRLVEEGGRSRKLASNSAAGLRWLGAKGSRVQIPPPRPFSIRSYYSTQIEFESASKRFKRENPNLTLNVQTRRTMITSRWRPGRPRTHTSLREVLRAGRRYPLRTPPAPELRAGRGL